MLGSKLCLLILYFIAPIVTSSPLILKNIILLSGSTKKNVHLHRCMCHNTYVRCLCRYDVECNWIWILTLFIHEFDKIFTQNPLCYSWSEYIYHFMYLRMLLVITFILLQLPLFISLANLHFIETYRIFFVVNQNHKDNTYISNKCIGIVAR